MRRFLNRCGGRRENLCLLAGGTLPDPERAELEIHLVTCAGCQKYYDEVKRIAAPLADWEEAFAHIATDQVLQSRWAKDFRAATRPVGPRPGTHMAPVLDWYRDVIWPRRRIWTGFAAAWAAIFAINNFTHDTAQSAVAKSSRPSPEMVRAFLAHEGFAADLPKPDERSVAEPPKPSVPSPRSDRRPEPSASELKI
jgi:anti-sigma factor RsiW